VNKGSFWRLIDIRRGGFTHGTNTRPNMVYLISRSIAQGRKAGVISLTGVITGFPVHMLAAAIGVTAIFMAVPIAYELLK